MPPTPLIEVAAPLGSELEVVGGLDRRVRFPNVHGAPRPTVESLGALHLPVVGAGAAGMHVVGVAGQLGLGSISVCDRGRIKAESVLTHPVSPADIGLAKASLAGARAKAASPNTRVHVFDGPFEALPASVVASADIVILASDNISCDYCG